MNYLGIDVGSSSVKAVLVDDRGRIVDFVRTDVSKLLQRPYPSWTERDAEALWAAVKVTLRKLSNVKNVKAVCVDATSGSVVPVNRMRKPLCPILLYSDKRAQEELKIVLENSRTAREYQTYLPLASYLVVPKILWLKRHLQSFGEVEKVLHENDFIQMKLTGKVFTSPNIAGKAHVDIRTGKYLKEIFDELDINLSLLPIIKRTGETVGFVTRWASKETGIPSETPVINGVTDATASDIAAGVLEPGQLNISMGTSVVLHAVTTKLVPQKMKKIYYKSYLKGFFLVGGATDAGMLPVANVSSLLGKSVMELDRKAEKVPPGCDGLIAQPQWIGSRIPYHNPDVKGFFVGLTEKNCTAGHIFRSLLEGNAFIIDEVMKIIEEVTGEEIAEVRTSGGGSESDVQNQIISDVTGRRVSALQMSGAAIGSAILAAWGVNGSTSITEIVNKTVEIRKIFEPNPLLKQTYEIKEHLLRRITASVYPAE